MSMRSQNKISAEAGMSSMTDLVFLLLIFFIILSTLAKNANEIDLPQGGTSRDEVSTTKVFVRDDNTILVNKNIVPIDALESEIIKVIDKDKVVELYADKQSDFGIAAEVIEIVKQNQWKIVLMTKK